MRIHVNGDEREIGEAETLASLLEAMKLADRRIAVECNGEIVPRSLHDRHRLEAGDRVEIVHAIGGG